MEFLPSLAPLLALLILPQFSNYSSKAIMSLCHNEFPWEPLGAIKFSNRTLEMDSIVKKIPEIWENCTFENFYANIWTKIKLKGLRAFFTGLLDFSK